MLHSSVKHATVLCFSLAITVTLSYPTPYPMIGWRNIYDYLLNSHLNIVPIASPLIMHAHSLSISPTPLIMHSLKMQAGLANIKRSRSLSCYYKWYFLCLWSTPPPSSSSPSPFSSSSSFSFSLKKLWNGQPRLSRTRHPMRLDRTLCSWSSVARPFNHKIEGVCSNVYLPTLNGTTLMAVNCNPDIKV